MLHECVIYYDATNEKGAPLLEKFYRPCEVLEISAFLSYFIIPYLGTCWSLYLLDDFLSLDIERQKLMEEF